MVIRRVGPLSVAKIAGVLYAIMGLFIGAIFSLISMVMGSAMNQANPEMPAFAGVMLASARSSRCRSSTAFSASS